MFTYKETFIVEESNLVNFYNEVMSDSEAVGIVKIDMVSNFVKKLEGLDSHENYYKVTVKYWELKEDSSWRKALTKFEKKNVYALSK